MTIGNAKKIRYCGVHGCHELSVSMPGFKPKCAEHSGEAAKGTSTMVGGPWFEIKTEPAIQAAPVGPAEAAGEVKPKQAKRKPLHEPEVVVLGAAQCIVEGCERHVPKNHGRFRLCAGHYGEANETTRAALLFARGGASARLTASALARMRKVWANAHNPAACADCAAQVERVAMLESQLAAFSDAVGAAPTSAQLLAATERLLAAAESRIAAQESMIAALSATYASADFFDDARRTLLATIARVRP